jgi:hypothetical protein
VVDDIVGEELPECLGIVLPDSVAKIPDDLLGGFFGSHG